MTQYLLSTFVVEGKGPGGPQTPEEMQTFMSNVIALEEEMEDAGAFVFGGALHSADTSTVLVATDEGVITTDGPFVESKEHIGGFYIINAVDLDEALDWAKKVTVAINNPIEVRPFQATGKVADNMPEA